MMMRKDEDGDGQEEDGDGQEEDVEILECRERRRQEAGFQFGSTFSILAPLDLFSPFTLCYPPHPSLSLL